MEQRSLGGLTTRSFQTGWIADKQDKSVVTDDHGAPVVQVEGPAFWLNNYKSEFTRPAGKVDGCPCGRLGGGYHDAVLYWAPGDASGRD